MTPEYGYYAYPPQPTMPGRQQGQPGPDGLCRLHWLCSLTWKRTYEYVLVRSVVLLVVMVQVSEVHGEHQSRCVCPVRSVCCIAMSEKLGWAVNPICTGPHSHDASQILAGPYLRRTTTTNRLHTRNDAGPPLTPYAPSPAPVCVDCLCMWTASCVFFLRGRRASFQASRREYDAADGTCG